MKKRKRQPNRLRPFSLCLLLFALVYLMDPGGFLLRGVLGSLSAESAPVDRVVLLQGAAEDTNEHEGYRELPLSAEEKQLLTALGVLVGEKTPLPAENADTPMPPAGDVQVVIFHTHTTESYFPTGDYYYEPLDENAHTNDLDFSVARAGRVLKEALWQKGINAVQDVTIHDIPATPGVPYTKARATIKNLMELYGEEAIYIDLHRDAVGTREVSRNAYLCDINGTKTARFSLVVGKNHKDFETNMALAKGIAEIAEAKYPGLFKNLIESEKNKYNQDLSENLLLVELGSYGNTLEEAMETAGYLADILSARLAE